MKQIKQATLKDNNRNKEANFLEKKKNLNKLEKDNCKIKSSTALKSNNRKSNRLSNENSNNNSKVSIKKTHSIVKENIEDDSMSNANKFEEKDIEEETKQSISLLIISNELKDNSNNNNNNNNNKDENSITKKYENESVYINELNYWRCVCSSLEDWHILVKKYKSTKKKINLELAKLIENDYLPSLPILFQKAVRILILFFVFYLYFFLDFKLNFRRKKELIVY